MEGAITGDWVAGEVDWRMDRCLGKRINKLTFASNLTSSPETLGLKDKDKVEVHERGEDGAADEGGVYIEDVIPSKGRRHDEADE